MPETVASLIAFLLLVTPGICFELLRESSRPERVRSTFRETAVVVVASVVLSGAALAVLLLVREVESNWLPSPQDLARSPGASSTEHLGLVVRALTAHVVLACGLAYAWHRLLCWKRPGGKVSPNPAWFEIVRGNANPRNDRVLVSVELQDGSGVRGLVKGYDLTPDQSLRSLVLAGSDSNPLVTRRASTAVESPVDPGWAYVVVPAEHIKLATVAFVD